MKCEWLSFNHFASGLIIIDGESQNQLATSSPVHHGTYNYFSFDDPGLYFYIKVKYKILKLLAFDFVYHLLFVNGW